jgi:hypothetical protein
MVEKDIMRTVISAIICHMLCCGSNATHRVHHSSTTTIQKHAHTKLQMMWSHNSHQPLSKYGIQQINKMCDSLSPGKTVLMLMRRKAISADYYTS